MKIKSRFAIQKHIIIQSQFLINSSSNSYILEIGGNFYSTLCRTAFVAEESVGSEFFDLLAISMQLFSFNDHFSDRYIVCYSKHQCRMNWRLNNRLKSFLQGSFITRLLIFLQKDLQERFLS